MNRKKVMERKLVCKTIHNLSVSKMGQAILKKNPYEIRVLTDKLEDIEIHKRKWKNDFCGRVFGTRQEFKQGRNNDTLGFIRLSNGGVGGKEGFNTECRHPQRVFTAGLKLKERIYKRKEKYSEAPTSRQQETSQKAASREKISVSELGKERKLATDVKVYLNDKLSSPIQWADGKSERERKRGSVTPNCMTPFIRHSCSAFKDQSKGSDSDDATSKRKCTNCAKIVLKVHPTSQSEDGKPVVVHEAPETDTLSAPVLSPQESTAPGMPRKKLSDTQPCFIPTPPPPAQKHSHIWRTRVDEIIWRRRVVCGHGFLNREKVSNLQWKPSTLSPVKYARFLGLQSLLVPVTKGKVEQQIDRVDFLLILECISWFTRHTLCLIPFTASALIRPGVFDNLEQVKQPTSVIALGGAPYRTRQYFYL